MRLVAALKIYHTLYLTTDKYIMMPKKGTRATSAIQRDLANLQTRDKANFALTEANNNTFKNKTYTNWQIEEWQEKIILSLFLCCYFIIQIAL